MKKKRPFVLVATPGTKGHPLLSRTGVPGWETGTTAVSQPGQINVFVVVVCVLESSHLWKMFIVRPRHGALPSRGRVAGRVVSHAGGLAQGVLIAHKVM